MSSSIKYPAQIVRVATVYNVSTDTLIEYLDSEHELNLSPRSYLTQLQLDSIEKQFHNQRAIKEQATGSIKVEWDKIKSNTKSSKEKKENPHQTESYSKLRILNLEEDSFQNSKGFIYYKDKNVETYFSDQDAIELCEKLTSSFTRQLCKDYHAATAEIRKRFLYQIHYIANKTLTIYGGKIITFILGLKRLQHFTETIQEVQTYRQVRPEFPFITFSTKQTLLYISFYAKESHVSNKLIPDIKVYSPTAVTNRVTEVGTMDPDGYMEVKLKEFIPYLRLFIDQSKDGFERIYSGVETGFCAICSRPLTVVASIRRGIGPVCARNSGIYLSSDYQLNA